MLIRRLFGLGSFNSRNSEWSCSLWAPECSGSSDSLTLVTRIKWRIPDGGGSRAARHPEETTGGAHGIKTSLCCKSQVRLSLNRVQMIQRLCKGFVSGWKQENCLNSRRSTPFLRLLRAKLKPRFFPYQAFANTRRSVVHSKNLLPRTRRDWQQLIAGQRATSGLPFYRFHISPSRLHRSFGGDDRKPLSKTFSVSSPDWEQLDK